MMVLMPGRDLRDAGWADLAAGNWDAAAEAFERALKDQPESPAALDGLGLALWWSRRTAEALQVRARAYAAYRHAGKAEAAARVAVWLAREHRALFRNEAVAGGWLRRAESSLQGAEQSEARGWILLARAEATTGNDAVELAREAVAVAQGLGAADLEVTALARLGQLEVTVGLVQEGSGHLDEAMAAATAGEGFDPQSFGEACCALMEAADLTGDVERVAHWGGAVTGYLATYDYPPLAAYGSTSGSRELSTFCGACCGGIYLVTGRLDEAESELLEAIASLRASGMQSRCVHPVTQLADLRIVQGRLEEARLLLLDHEDLPEAVRPLASLELAEGSHDIARRRLSDRIAELTDRQVVAFPLWILLVDVELARGDVEAAQKATDAAARIASLTGGSRHAAEVSFARGKVAAARDDGEAPELLRAAAKRFSAASLSLLACRARMALARAAARDERGVAVSEAKAALAGFERLGATVDADGAAAFLRELGVKGRTGPKGLGLLSKREIEVLRLVSEGLSNAEVAERLFISVKTAGHHVSNILAKLGLRSRTEAAAYAALNLGRDEAYR